MPIGLVTGFGFSILTIVYRSQYGGRHLLGGAKDTGLYSDIRNFENVSPTDDKMIACFGASGVRKNSTCPVLGVIYSMRIRLPNLSFVIDLFY